VSTATGTSPARQPPAGPAVEFPAGQRVDFITGDPGLVRIAFALPGAVPESLAIGDTTLEIRETPP